MKKTLLTIALSVIATAGLHAQGTVEFDNLIGGNPATSPKIFAPDGTTGLDNGYAAELLGGADAGSLNVLGSSLTFFAASTGGAGFVNTATGSLRTVTGVDVNQTATLMVRAWRLSDGATFAEAQAAVGGQWGQSAAFTQTLGGTPVGAPSVTPPKLTNLQSFNLTVNQVPEPSVLLLGVAGAGLFLFRRKAS